MLEEKLGSEPNKISCNNSVIKKFGIQIYFLPTEPQMRCIEQHLNTNHILTSYTKKISKQFLSSNILYYHFLTLNGSYYYEL
jgi:hypothetical protein